jgi:competence protein ComEA
LDDHAPAWRVFDATPAPQPVAPGDATAPPPRLADRFRQLKPPVLGAIAGAVALALLAAVVAVAGIPGPGSADEPDEGLAALASDGALAGKVVVSVTGAVAHPGVYHLDPGARVADAIAAAGGYGPRVAAARVDADLNLAAVVRDGDRIAVPSRDDPSPGPPSRNGANSTGGSGETLIELNGATAAELDSLPGIGPATAAKIIASREEQPFASVDDLRGRKLVGAATFEKLRALVTVR